MAQLLVPDVPAAPGQNRDAEQGEVVKQKVEEILEEKKDSGSVTPAEGSAKEGPSGISVQVALASEGLCCTPRTSELCADGCDRADGTGQGRKSDADMGNLARRALKSAHMATIARIHESVVLT